MKLLVVLALVGLVFFLVNGLLFLVYNAVAPHIGLPALGFWIVAGIHTLLGAVGACFRGATK